jgi:hypothetical protein
MGKRKNPIKLGSKVECLVTGFVGTVTCKAEYLKGAKTCLVKGRIEDKSKPAPEAWIEEGLLKVVGRG